MNNTLLRIFAIMKADFLVRFRRLSTAVIFVGLCIMAYMWVPDPATGRALLQMNEQRALYNSPALAMSTAALCTILLTLIGFYMVSNTIKRDIRTRTGFILASTTMRNWEYILGKFTGNVVFLSAIVAGFMISSMGMQLVRGEAPLQLFPFLKHYLIMVPPCIVFVSAISVFFECTPLLSSKFGDIAYFFVWIAVIAVTAIAEDKGGGAWARYLDVSGMAFMLHQVKTLTNNDSVAIGSSEYDMTKPPFVFEGYVVSASDIVPRVISTLWPMLFLLPALFFFHRFNPAKVKTSGPRGHHSWLGRINMWIKPLTRRILSPIPMPAGLGASFGGSVLSDSILTLQLNPMALLLAIGLSLFSLVNTPATALAAIFALLSVILSDVATREGASGTSGIVFSSPYLKPRFILWKWLSTLITVFLFVSIPFVKTIFASPFSALGLLIGAAFISAAATALGSMSSNPKTFIVTSLLFWYLVMNDKGQTPSFDFAGWYGTATAAVQAKYVMLTAALLLVAETHYRWKLKRKF